MVHVLFVQLTALDFLRGPPLGRVVQQETDPLGERFSECGVKGGVSSPPIVFGVHRARPLGPNTYWLCVAWAIQLVQLQCGKSPITIFVGQIYMRRRLGACAFCPWARTSSPRWCHLAYDPTPPVSWLAHFVPHEALLCPLFVHDEHPVAIGEVSEVGVQLLGDLGV